MKYYIYRLDAKRNKFGNPYYGMTDNLNKRTYKWRYELKDPSIELVVIEEHDDEDYCWEREQDVYRVPNGWKRESHNRRKHREMSVKGGETQQSEESRERRSEIWNRPGMREKHSEISTEVWQRPGYREKQSEIATEVQNRPRVKEAQRIAQCNFSKITVCDGSWFIANGSREGSTILKEMGYIVSHKTINHYVKMNESLDVPEPFTGRNYPHKKGSIHILIVPSTLEEYKRYQNDYGTHSDSISSNL